METHVKEMVRKGVLAKAAPVILIRNAWTAHPYMELVRIFED
jgi:hypothetical protein